MLNLLCFLNYIQSLTLEPHSQTFAPLYSIEIMVDITMTKMLMQAYIFA